ncbi:MAG: HpcH/HpaI aldolase family protein [Bacteroidota bacterium]
MVNSLIPPNKLKTALKNGKTVFGTMLVEIRQPSVMQLLANSGFDFVLIDNEHGPFTVETIADLSRAARQLGVTPIVRVPEITYAHITQALDGGAQGIMIPRVTHPQQVMDAVSIMKYPPMGRRGSVVARGHTEFKSGKVDEALSTANDESMLVVQIETVEALTHMDDILAVKGVDAALVGPTDLSVALGVAGQMESPVLNSAIEKTLEACRKHAVIPAIHMNDLDAAIHWTKRGMKVVSFNSEAGLMMRSGQQAVAMMKQAAPGN